MNLATLVFAVSQTLIGQWQFYKMVYQGQELPPRDSNLVLRYTFAEDGVSHLKWFYKNDAKYNCERRGEYTAESSFFNDKVVWVNPENSIQCAGDSDMQLGRTSHVPYFFIDEDLYTAIPLNDDYIYYVWKKIEDEE